MKTGKINLNHSYADLAVKGSGVNQFGVPYSERTQIKSVFSLVNKRANARISRKTEREKELIKQRRRACVFSNEVIWRKTF